jgi:hypothetical protein
MRRLVIVVSSVLSVSLSLVLVGSPSSGATQLPPPKVVCSAFTSQSRHSPSDKLNNCSSVAGSRFRSGTTDYFGGNGSGAPEITWNGGAQTQISSGTYITGPTGMAPCPSEGKSFGQVDVGWWQAVVASSTSSGPGIPAGGDSIAFPFCSYNNPKKGGATKWVLVPGTTLTITTPQPPTAGVTYSFKSSWGCSPSPYLPSTFSETFHANGDLSGFNKGTLTQYSPTLIGVHLKQTNDTIIAQWDGSGWAGQDDNNSCIWTISPS